MIRYELSMPRPNRHLFHVEITIPDVVGETVDIVMPAWTPGSYKIRDYAKNVQDFSAGRLRWSKIDKNRWRVEAGGARTVGVSYDVWAFELSVQTSHLDADHGFLNGASVFAYADGRKDEAVELEVRPPKRWRIATGLDRSAPNRFRAPDYDRFIDCPIEIGRFQLRTFRVRGIEHRLVVDGPGNYDHATLVKDVRKIVEVEAGIFRQLPYKHYTFILHTTPERGGGLEHLNSTALQYPYFQFKPREKYENFLELVAHEFFHLWNVKRIHPTMLGPFDYEKEVYTTLLWVMEGFTSYYDTIVPCLSGQYAVRRYLKKMAERIQKYEEKPGRRRQSLSSSSFDTWIKHYQPNENTLNCQMSYYEKGELIGMCLDLEIRHRTRNRRSLDDVMRALYDRFGREMKGFAETEFQRVCEEMAGGSLAEFFRDHIDGVAEIDWNRFLGYAGLECAKEYKKPEEGSPVEKEKPWLGIGTMKADGRIQVTHVIEDSPADHGGLSARDEVVALDGVRIDPESWERRLEDRRVGDRVTFTIFRLGLLREVDVALGRKQNVNFVIRKLKKVGPLQKRIYESWLRTKWKY